MMAEFEYVLMTERKDNSDGKTMFGLFPLVRTSLLNQWTYDREPVYIYSCRVLCNVIFGKPCAM